MKNVLRVVITILLLADLSLSFAQFPGCPQVVTNAHATVPCGQTCTNLYASAEGGYSTTTYTYAAIPYAPPVAPGTGTAFTLNQDDGWSSRTTLPFHFCFFGTEYTRAIFSTNGSVGFNVANAGAGSNWEIFGAVPASLVANGETDLGATINGPWQDLDNTHQGTIYSYLGGTAPCRYFAVSWVNCAMYGDSESVNTDYCSHDDRQTQQIIIYETSNVIDINIANKDVPCDNKGAGYWNGGLAVEGLINANETTFIGPANRNATRWSAVNDAMRFTPAGLPTYTITWFQGTTQVGTGSPFQVCPTGPTTYIAKANYTNCDNSVITVSDSVFVDLAHLTVADSAHQPSCGSSNGSVYASFNANSGVISYGWAPNGLHDTVLNNLGPGTYIFTVSDSAGCSAADTVVLSSGITVSVANDTVACSGGFSGVLKANVSDTTGTVTYAWNNGDSTARISGLAAGTYTVTVTSGSCSATASGTVVNLGGSPVVITTVKVVDVTCNGGDNGEIVVSASGGPLPYIFEWSDSVVGPDSITGLSAGTYTVKVIDSVGCFSEANYTITQGPQITVNVPNDTFNACSGANGVLVADVTGGAAPFTYTWGNTAQTTDTITGLAVGTYPVTVTAPGGCSATASGSVYSSGGSPVIINTLKQVNVTCNGDSTGEIVVIASGGPPPYSYAWSDSIKVDSVTGLTAGNYTVTVTDRFGCTADTTYTITQGTAITFNTPVIDSVTCFGGNNGSITVSATGGTGSIGYKWNVNNDSTTTAGNLSVGTYTVTATDSVGCTATASYSVGQPTQIVVDSLILDSATCASGGAIIIGASGGTGPYTYTWSNLLTGDSIGNLAGATYVVTITDQNGCSITSSATVPAGANVVSFGPPVIVEPTCYGYNNGSITATASGGTGSITYSWSNVDSLSKDSNLIAGTYSVTISDSVGCSASTTYVLNQPSAVTISNVVIDSITCNGGNNGSITVTASGGTGSYTYVWSGVPSSPDLTDSATGLSANVLYSIVVTDSLGCSATGSWTLGQPTAIVIDSSVVTPVGCTTLGSIVVTASGGTGALIYAWSNSGSGDSIGNLSAGTYSVIITDQNGCSVSASYSVGTVAGAVVIDSATIVNVTCNGDTSGSITVVATDSSVGGRISYAWAGSTDTTATLSNLGVGSYCVTVTDSLGCSASACYNISQPNAIVFGTPVLTPPLCNDSASGCITISATGGSGAITYKWSNADSGTTNCGLIANTYTITATDSVGCTATVSYILTQPSPDSISSVVSNITCNGANNGSITVTATGGAGGFTYIWGGGITGSTISGLSTGTYCVVATDMNGCSISVCDSISQPAALVINAIVSTPVTCLTLGTDSVSASGGTGTLSYRWGSGQSTPVITGLVAGTYCVTVTDSLSCTAAACDTVLNNSSTVVIDSAHVSNLTCTVNGSIVVYASGGNTGLTYTWTGTAQTGDSVGNLAAGNYSVTVSDSTGCSASASYTVNPATPLTITNAAVDSATCSGANNGSITITANGTGTLVYSWSPNVSTTNTATGLDTGTYCVVITDSLSCSASACYTIGQPAPLSVSGSITNLTCGSFGSIGVTVTGGTGAYTYTWSPNTLVGPNPTGLLAGQYILTVTDQNNCGPVIDTFNVTGLGGTPISIFSVQVNDVAPCFGGSNGSVVVHASGGVHPLSYAWTGTSQTSDSITGLSAGNYSVTVTDSAGCTVSGGPYTVGQPLPLVVSGIVDSVSCASPGSIAVTASGGTGPLSITWIPNTVTGFNPSPLPAGQYIATVSDSVGCSKTDTFVVGNTHGSIAMTDTITNVTCNGLSNGSITVTPSGGAGYTYTWTPNVGTGATVINLAPGTYSVDVTDVGGCSVTGTYTITQPAPISLTLSTPGALCASVDTGRAFVIVNSGGVAPYSYHWSNNADTLATDTGIQAGNVAVTVTDANGCTVTASKTVGQDVFDFGDNIIQPTCAQPIPSLAVTITISGIPPYTYTLNGVSYTTPDSSYVFDSIYPGTYLLTVTDGNGCSLSQSPIVNTPPAIDSVTAYETPTSCTSVDNGQVSIDIAPSDSSHSPFTYSLNGGPFQSDSIFTGLAPGSYSVVVHNNLGCNDTVTAPVVVTSDSSLTVTFTPDTLGQGPPSAINSDTITLQPNVSGFVNPVYVWSPTTGLSCPTCANPGYISDPSLSVNGPMVYYVHVSDSLNPQCTAYDSIVIIPKGQFAMPSAFTPNGDGVDDLFGPVKYSYVTVTAFHIYNRWGQLVHNSTDPWDGKFDGKEQPAGAYVYYIEVTVPGGATGYVYGAPNTTQKLEGSVILLR